MVYITDRGLDYTSFVENEEDVDTFEQLCELERLILGIKLPTAENYRDFLNLDAKLRKLKRRVYLVESPDDPRLN